MILQALAPDMADQAWPLIAPWIEQLADRYPDDWPISQTREQIRKGFVVPWLIWDEKAKEPYGTALTELQVKPSGRKFFHVHVAGKEPPKWVFLLQELELYGAQQGAEVSEIIGREGWQRSLPDYRKERLAVFTKELSNGSS